MSDSRRFFFGAVLLLASAACPDSSFAARSFAIVGVHVVPMDAERVLEDQTVIVVDGRIETVAPRAEAVVPPDLTRIEGHGRYLMPGLADLHVHVRHADELVNYLAWGVTTVMHLGGSGVAGTELLALRGQIAAGSLLGPNLYATGRIFDGDPALPRGALRLTDPATARGEVEKLAAAGFDFVKIYNNVSQPVFEAIVDEAGLQELPVFGHIPRSFDPLIALSGGQSAIAHTEELFFTYFEGPRDTKEMDRGYRPDLSKIPALVEVLLENSVAVMPDLCFTFGNLLMWDSMDHLWNDAEAPYLHPRTASSWRGGGIDRRTEIENFIVRGQWKYALLQELTLRFQEAGVLQVVGTDASLAGLFPGKAVHRELTELVKAGLSNFDTLAIATRNAGEFARRYLDENVRFGQIRPGYRADLVLVDENPLEDVRHARAVRAVAVSGRWVEGAELDERRAVLAARYRLLEEIAAGVEAALETDRALAVIEPLLTTHAGDEEIVGAIERRINSAGYAAAGADRLDRAHAILELNARLFPDSANTWDSLAEITAERGDREGAIELYRKALEVDPDFANAARQLERLLAEGVE